MTQQSIRVGIEKSVSRVACRTYLSSNQADLTDSAWVKVTLNTIDYDLGGNFDETTNNRFTAPVTGLYRIAGKVDFVNVVANKSYGAAIYKNGVLNSHAFFHTGSATSEIEAIISDELFLQENDYIELYAQAVAGVSTVDVESGITNTNLIVRLITKEGIRQ